MWSSGIGNLVGALAVVGTLIVSPPSFGQETEDIARLQAARDLADEGYDLFEQGRYEEALDRLERAFELVGAPTIKVLEAETLIHLGRLLEAREAYEVVGRMQLDPEASPAFHAAKKQAAEALVALKPRIPGITVVLEGNHPEGLLVTIDNQPLEAAAIGIRWPVDPGRHVVEVSSDAGTIASRQIESRAGDHERVVVVLATTSPSAEAVSPVEHGRHRAHRTATWTSFGLGAAGLAVGVGAGAVMLDKKAELDDECRDVCPPEMRDDHDAFQRARNVSWVGYGVGSVGVGVGVALLLLQPRPEREVPETGRLRPFIGPATVGVAGRF